MWILFFSEAGQTGLSFSGFLGTSEAATEGVRLGTQNEGSFWIEATDWMGVSIDIYITKAVV